MKYGLIRLVVTGAVAVAVGTVMVSAQQPPAGPNNGVQVAVPQGSAEQQAQDAARQRQQQQSRNRLANQPAPRTADGHIMLGNSPGQKGVWIGSNLGFCNSNTVAAPPSLNPGATQQAAAQQGGGRAGGARAGGAGQAAAGGGFGRGAAGPCTPVP